MEYKIHNKKSYNIHAIKTNKFKTVRMEIVFSSNLKKEEMPTYSFLADIMSDTSKNYKTRKDISIALEELYKATFYSSSSKVGNLFTLNFTFEFINPEYIKEKKYLEKCLSFPLKIINNPNINNNEFDINNFNIIKRRMKESINNIKESSERYALINALQCMDKASPTSYRVLGDLDLLEKITPSSLYNAYLNLFEHFNCDIYLIGNIDKEYISIISEYFENYTIKINSPKLYVDNRLRKRVLMKSMASNFIQSTLVMIYNIKDLTKIDKDISFHIFNYILAAGGLNSRLYKYLRNDNSLCYGVRSIYLKYDGLLIVLVSLDKNNVNKASKLIKKAISELKKGVFTKEEIEFAKKNLEFSLKLSLDNNASILNNYVFNYFDDLPLINKRIDLIKEVSKEDVLRCSNSLCLNTVFVLDAGDNDERD